MEFILVHFPGTRRVLVDGIDRGEETNEVLEVDAGPHTITLRPGKDSLPRKHNINAHDTIVLSPLAIAFTMQHK
jgi:hypothetical protein